MILDEIAHASRYDALGDQFARAFALLRGPMLSSLDPGRHEIDGARIVALISDYDTKPRETCLWEAHRRHIDIQVVLRGAELCGRTDLATIRQEPYDEERDILLGRGTGDFFVLTPGRFVILFPEDAHMPGVTVTGPSPVRKLVLKLSI